MQIFSTGDNLHEMSKHVFWENKKNVSICRLLKILPSMLSVKHQKPGFLISDFSYVPLVRQVSSDSVTSYSDTIVG